MTTEPHNASPGARGASGIGDELKDDAAHLKHAIGDRARQEAQARKGEAANALGSASSALNNAADELQRNADAPDWLASAVKQAATKIDAMAGQIQGRNIDEIGQNVADFARKNPGAFLAASAAAGFAAARVLRAGADRSQDHDTGPENGSGANRKPNDTTIRTGGTGEATGFRNDNGVVNGGLADTIERDIGGVAP
ncbi:hypothetical protein [Blastomonas sp.]|uniref:hypothetical protein n=1 Tax=Blastomonas sp. TaxID=1909299 RepID=UPI002605E148|nr:hypothetical protein [Blastomonas sp.]MDM7955731.1 hypothetical protein [Blastomonas sp.]